VKNLRHAIITAGTKGLGKQVSEYFLKKGYTLTINYRSDLERLKTLKKEWQAYANQYQFVQGDITNKKDIVNIVNEAKKTFGRIDCLINNAGPFVFDKKPLVEYKDDEWYEMIEGNLSAIFHFAKLVIPIMRKQQFGRFITYGFQDVEHSPGWTFRAAFTAAKVGLASLTRSIAKEEASYGITANMVSPGDIKGYLKEIDIQTAKSLIDTNTPVGRAGSGEDIARVIAFLCEENSDFITGSIIPVSGGVHVIK